MSKHKYHKKRKQQKNISALIGAGLVVAGVALLFLLTQKQPSVQASSSEFSVTPMEVNFAAPELALQNLEGQSQSIADFAGKVVLVNNWATWCPPCKAEMPSLKKFHDAHAKEGFTVIAVEAGDGLEEVQAFAKSFGLTFPVWLDPNGAALNAFHNANLPNSYVIDRTGTIRLAWTGEISLTMLEKFVTPLIAE